MIAQRPRQRSFDASEATSGGTIIAPATASSAGTPRMA